ncbi:glycine/betaine ABC transporter ATP-binding protein [Limnochorda pilosa]|uniref:Quaternary amine transport ATP-binding protein n=1 Tax=Limnochorda pilosa TaxID=1555112 RepID=A0A0K2SJE2_LIMPI|nr:glycine/betaine ABC transporter ATP-binding protein [Limnochorda pilosa]
MPELRVEGVTRIFGPNPAEALHRLRQGADKEEILRRSGHTVAVADARFHVNPGEIFVIMGLSGSGKSTLLRCINRLIEPTSGRVVLDGEDVTAATPARLRELRRQRIGMVFQHFALLPHRTVLRNVEYGLEVRGVAPEERRKAAMEALEQVGLEAWAHHAPDELSGGMKQRVGLARALATQADLLLMDEAFSALDPLIRREMQGELLELQASLKRTIVFITHDLNEALSLGDRIAIMQDGRIIQIDAPEGILAHPASEYVAAFTQDVDRSRVFTARSVMRRPETVVAPAGPRVALRKMRELGLSSVFVVDRSGRLEGLVRAERVVDAVQRGEPQLEPLMEHDLPHCAPDTPLAAIIPLAASQAVPVPVVDERGRLAGIVPRVALLAGLAGNVAHHAHHTGNGATTVQVASTR